MGAWGSGPLDNDSASDFLDQLCRTPRARRTESLLAALDAAANGGWLDIEDAAGAVVSAFLVAAARSPDHLSVGRQRVVEHASSVHDVHTFPALVGDMRVMRTARVAGLASRAIDQVVEDSELRDLSEEDLDAFASSFDDLRAALRAPLRRWTAADLKPPKIEPLRRRWVAGTLLGIDLGDGSRSYAQLLESPYVACYDSRQPVTDPQLSTAEIVTRPVLFTISVNEYMDRPAGWQTIGPLPAGYAVLPKPTTFMQDTGYPQNCSLILDGDWTRVVRATQQECIGLERAGIGWYPENLEERLRCHYAGRPHPETERTLVRLSCSLVRVCTWQEARAGYEAWRFPAQHNESEPLTAFYPASLVPQFASGYGPNRDDLVMMEVDEAAIDIAVTYGPAVPDDPTSPVVPWSPWISRLAMVGVHDLVPTDGGSYKLARPWSPTYP